ncbi:hypothetical protein MHYP_G00073740 [Metynnis hypsauchen]
MKRSRNGLGGKANLFRSAPELQPDQSRGAAIRAQHNTARLQAPQAQPLQSQRHSNHRENTPPPRADVEVNGNAASPRRASAHTSRHGRRCSAACYSSPRIAHSLSRWLLVQRDNQSKGRSTRSPAASTYY